MDRPFDKDSAKDKFAVEQVVPFLLERIRHAEESQRTVDLATSMCVFPYRTGKGTRLGCLGEPDTSWYFTRDGAKTVSTKSYRILDTSVLKPDVVNGIKELLGRLELISEYSEAVVINELVDRMRNETHYTATWWECAFDVYGLWEQGKTRISLRDATSSMNNDSFLFRDEYCPPKLREQLIRFGVFRDINDAVAKEHFWDRLPRNGEAKARELLREMGVPTTFVAGGKINHRILDLVTRIANEVDFAMSLSKDDRRLCDLCHMLLFGRIYKDSSSTLLDMITSPESHFLKGIPVLNAAGQYVPLALDLFYADKDLPGSSPKKDAPPFVFDEDQLKRKRRRPIAVPNSLERLRIDAKKYGKDMLDAIPSVHNFKEVVHPFSYYSLGLVGSIDGPECFYKWVWNHSQHERLAYNILRHFSGSKYTQPTVPEEDVKLVLDVMDETEGGDSDCSFVIVMGSDAAFDEARLLNRVPRLFPNVSVVTYGKFKEFDPHRYLEDVLVGANVSGSVRRSVRADSIWDNSYLVSCDDDRYAGDYLYARVFDRRDSRPAILFWPSSDEDYYATAVARYIDDTYGTAIADYIAADVDWRAQYRSLADGVDRFLSDCRDVEPVENIYGTTARLDDVRTFAEEKRIWEGLKAHRDLLLDPSSTGSPTGKGGNRMFLSSTYQGRCQLCGTRMAMGPQRSLYWTFRMVKKSDNELADLPANIFCLCPSCHGELQYGSYMGRDMTAIVNRSREYSSYIQRVIDSEEFDDNFPSAIEEFADDEIEIEGFHRPIVCDVIVNGIVRHMAFSWEHFMRIAFLLTDANDQYRD